MGLLSRVRYAITGPPKGAHGQRNVDGSFFSVWKGPCGHYEIGGLDAPPEGDHCTECTLAKLRARIDGTSPPAIPASGGWVRATRTEAHDFVFRIEGPGMYDRVGFRML